MTFNFLSKNKKTQIGFDITPEGITGVVVRRENNKVFLKNLCFKKFDTEVFQNGIITNNEKIEEVLNEFQKEKDFNENIVSISIPSNTAFIKTLNFPDIPHEELKIIISNEIQKHVPLPINEVNYDFEIIRQIKDPANLKNEVEVVLVALSKHIVQNYVELFYRAGFNVTAIDISPFAVIRTLANAGMIDDSENLSISALIGYENTDINIIYKGMPIFFHNVQGGKKNLLEHLCTSLEISNDEAENLLPEIALVIPGMEVQLDSYMSKASNAARILYNNISSEILKIIEFYLSQNNEVIPIDQIILSGSGVCVKNIDKYFTNRIKIDTVLCESLNNLDLSETIAKPGCHDVSEAISPDAGSESSLSLKIPDYATAVGLALKG